MENSDIIERLKGKRKVILTHGNSDMDAIGSAYALRNAFGPADIYAPAGVDRVARMVADKLEIPILDSADLSDYELVVVVDSSSPDLLQNPDLTVPPNSLIIDHHAPTGKWEGMDFHCDDTRTSCCEIVKDIIDDDRSRAAQLISAFGGKEQADEALVSLSRFLLYRKTA